MIIIIKDLNKYNLGKIMIKWNEMCEKTELWISYNIIFPNTDKGIISQGIIDGFKVPSIKLIISVASKIL